MSEWVKILIGVCVAIQIIGVCSTVWFAIDDEHNCFCFFIKCSLTAFESNRINLLGKILSPIVDLLLLPSSIVAFVFVLIVLGVVRLFTTKEGFEDLFVKIK